MDNILFITEGLTDEPTFLEKMFCIFHPNKSYNIYSYTTSIHTLVDKLFIEGELDKNLDIRLTLKEKETNKEKRKILSQKYKDIFLVFDLDPHNNKVKFQEIREMLNYFNDSSNTGKLYINYPMMQSHKHLKQMPDKEFKSKKIEISTLKNYKRIVGKQSKYTDITKYTYPIFMSIIAHHIQKANYIINGRYSLLKVEEFIQWNNTQIYDKQMLVLKKERQVYVLNTFLFNIIEYKPKELLNQLVNKKEIFLI